jgi:hypothetical protein
MAEYDCTVMRGLQNSVGNHGGARAFPILFGVKGSGLIRRCLNKASLRNVSTPSRYNICDLVRQGVANDSPPRVESLAP